MTNINGRYNRTWKYFQGSQNSGQQIPFSLYRASNSLNPVSANNYATKYSNIDSDNYLKELYIHTLFKNG